MMMGSFLSVAALFAATAALAQPRPSTTAMTCSAVRALVASQGAVVLGTGPQTYDRYVAHQGFCGLDQVTDPAYERSADTPQCFVGYRCVSRFRDTPETVR
jgi:hypothetical protein